MQYLFVNYKTAKEFAAEILSKIRK